MAKPTTRLEFKDYCLRALGDGAITINVTPQQIEDRIDEAIDFYQDYHHSAQRDEIISTEVTQADKDNRYIPVPSNVQSIIHVFKTNMGYSGMANWMSIKYQMRFDDVFYMSREGIKSYYISKQSLATFDHILSPPIRFRFTPNEQKLWIDFDWSYEVDVGHFIVFEARVALDPAQEQEMWGNRILQKLCIAYIKRQWGENLKKFTGVQMAGGVELNADKIYDSALEDIDKLETDFQSKYEFPVNFFTG